MEPSKNRHELLEEEQKAEEIIQKMEGSGSEKQVLLSMLDLQRQRNAVHLEYLQELRSLQSKYDTLYQPLNAQRVPVIGEIPDFWLRVLKNHSIGSSFVYEQDERLLKYLQDIRCIRDESSDNFVLEFEFAPNEFIENKVLTKKYFMASSEVMERAEGTEIKWKNENFTQKVKKNKKKGKKQQIKVVDRLSFFNFFKNVTMPGTKELDDMNDSEEDDLCDSVEDDYDLASEIKDEIIPNAVLFYMNVRGEIDSDNEDAPKADKVDASGSDQTNCKNQ